MRLEKVQEALKTKIFIMNTQKKMDVEALTLCSVV